MDSKEPLYLYALNDLNQVINIKDAVSDVYYSCPGCGERLIPHKGEIRSKHFKHFRSCVCDGETYLHKVGKLAFYQLYSQSTLNKTPISLELNRAVVCDQYKDYFGASCHSQEKASFNLIDYFDDVYLEVMHGSFRPDVLLKNSLNGEVIFVEIAVTHPCERDKIDSGIRIIEFGLSSEEDLSLLTQTPIRKGGRVEVHNFNVKPKCSNTCNSYPCTTTANILTVDATGNIKKRTGTHEELGKDLKRSSAPFVIIDGGKDLTVCIRKVLAKAWEQNIRRPNCHICYYSTPSINHAKVNCSKKKGATPYTEAEQCMYFEADLQ